MNKITYEYITLRFWLTHYLRFFWKGIKEVISLKRQGVKLSKAEIKKHLHWCTYRRHKQILREVHQMSDDLWASGYYDHLDGNE